MANHNDFGKEAEEAAAKYLQCHGYKILERNYRYLKAEIDIIAMDESTIVIVEVKARSSTYFMSPQDAVNNSKMKLLISAANQFLETYPENADVRFDIMSLTLDANKQLKIEHIKEAFDSADVRF